MAAACSIGASSATWPICSHPAMPLRHTRVAALTRPEASSCPRAAAVSGPACRPSLSYHHVGFASSCTFSLRPPPATQGHAECLRRLLETPWRIQGRLDEVAAAPVVVANAIALVSASAVLVLEIGNG
jgi:hypothetical protein